MLRYAFLSIWQNVQIFAVSPAEPVKFYVSVQSVWRELVPPYKLGAPTPPVLSHFSDEVLKMSPAGVLAMHIASTEFMVMTILCFVRALSMAH